MSVKINRNYQCTSPNNTGNRGRQGTKSDYRWIVVHYVGSCNWSTGFESTAKGNAQYFQRANVGASANYFVDSTDEVFESVPWDSDRYAWHCGAGTSGKYTYCIYDTDGVTFCCNPNSIGVEICTCKMNINSRGGSDPDWYFDPTTYRNAVEFIKYLMKEFNIDIDHVVRHYDVNTVHKLCPSQFVGNGIKTYYNRTGEQLWKQFKADLVENVTPAPTPEPTPAPTQDVDSVIWNHLKNNGFTDFATAGVMGNLYAECGLKSCNLQNTGNKKLNVTDEQFTAMVDNRAYAKDTFINDHYGYGLAQWTYWSLKKMMYEYIVEKQHKSIGDLTAQLEYLVIELKDRTKLINNLNASTSVRQASDIMLTCYERPADQSEAVQIKRANYGQTYYDKFHTEPQIFPSVPFLVKVIIDDLNYRTEPSMNGVVRGQTGKGIFTIVEVQNGWGRLKSGAGWIYIANPEYCTILTPF